MAKRDREHISIAEGLKKFIEQNRLQQGLDKVDVRDAWHHNMGEAISKYTERVTLERDTLIVHLTSSVLREELSYGKEKIIAMMNESLEKDLVKKLILR